MVRRALLTAGLLGLLGMHGLAPGHPTAHAAPVSMVHAATVAAAPAAEGHGGSAPAHHHHPAVHHDLCKAVTGGSASAEMASVPALLSTAWRTPRAPARSALAAAVDHHPPDILELGVLRI